MNKSSPGTTELLAQLTEWFDALDFDRHNEATRHAEYAELQRIVHRGVAQIPTGIEAADNLAEYLKLRGLGDEGDAANIIHILHLNGVQFAAPAQAPTPALQTAAELVVNTFKKDEAAGYRSRDRQFAIDILEIALSPISSTPGEAAQAPGMDELEAALRDAQAFISTALVSDINPTISKKALMQRIDAALSSVPVAQGAASHPLARRIVEFIDATDPFGDKFCAHDVKLIEGALSLVSSTAHDSAHPLCSCKASQRDGQHMMWCPVTRPLHSPTENKGES